MRFIVKIILGLIIFNAMLVTMSQFFPKQTTSIDDQAVNVSESYSDYNWNLNFESMLVTLVETGGAIFGVAAIIGVITRNPVWIGFGVLVGLITGLWISVSQSVMGIFDSYPEISIFYTLFGICLGIVTVVGLVETLTNTKEVGY